MPDGERPGLAAPNPFRRRPSPAPGGPGRPSARRRRSALAGLAVRTTVVLGLLAPVAVAPLGGQSPEARPELTLRDVVRATLEHNPEIRLQRQSRERARGAVALSAAPFDPTLSTSISANRVEEAGSGAGGVGSSAARSRLGYELTLNTFLRSGLVVSPRVELIRDDPAATSPVRSTGRAGLDLRIPLLEDRFGRGTGAVERSAVIDREAEDAALRHAAASALRRVTTAYWDYLGAHRSLEVLRGSEARAERLQSETRQLVEANERPAADLHQIRANVATKRAARIAGEQEVEEARRRLGLAMGVEANRIGELGPPGTGFPDPGDGDPLGSEDVPVLRRIALQERWDLRAAADRVRAGEARLEAARNELRPRLDLVGGVGYQTVRSGGEFGAFLRTLGPGDSGTRFSLRLEYEWPLSNSGARGRAIRRSAELRQREVARADLSREIVSGVRVAVAAVRRRRKELEQSEAAVSALRSAVEAERRRYQFGAATVIDLLTTADALSAARLRRVGRQVRYAASLTELRFRTGRLGARDAGAGTRGGRPRLPRVLPRDVLPREEGAVP